MVVRQRKLRWPVSKEISTRLPGRQISDVQRRGKYLLLHSRAGTLMIHLGMSGSLRLVATGTPPGKHDHVDIQFGKQVLRYCDPRKFGSLLWINGPTLSHPLLDNLGPEPLTDTFNATHLFNRSRKRNTAIKTFIMNSHVVVGVGNIYANEALYLAGIHPTRKAGKISLARYAQLETAIKQILTRAIKAGGTTLRDFTDSDGNPGYFSQSLYVYGRGGMPCENCGKPLKEIKQAQRATVYCTNCQR